MSPVIDFSEVKDLVPLPNGQYDAEIVYAQEGVSKNGNPKIDLRWKVLEGEYANRMVFDTLTFSPNSLFRVKNTLKALGWDVNKGGQVEISGGDLVGLQATIVVAIDQSTGTDESGEPYPERNRISKVKPLGSGPVAQLGDML